MRTDCIRNLVTSPVWLDTHHTATYVVGTTRRYRDSAPNQSPTMTQLRTQDTARVIEQDGAGIRQTCRVPRNQLHITKTCIVPNSLGPGVASCVLEPGDCGRLPTPKAGPQPASTLLPTTGKTFRTAEPPRFTSPTNPQVHVQHESLLPYNFTLAVTTYMLHGFTLICPLLQVQARSHARHGRCLETHEI